MAEAIVTFLIEQLAPIAVESIKEEVSLPKNAEEDVKKLKRNLEAVQAVLEDAEKKQWNEITVKVWLDNLEEACFEIDNVLDEWNTAILKLKIQKEEDIDDHKAMTNKKRRLSIPSLFPWCRAKASRLAQLHDIAQKIKNLNETLAEIAKQKDQFNLTMTTVKPLERTMTTSFIDETEVEGRDKDKEFLLSKLLGETNSQHNKVLRIIPIVGMGGLGKTTLAQIAYKDEKVIAHFDLRIWVCVSDPFDEIMVAKAIIEGVERKSPDVNALESLLQHVVKCIEGKRFLLILDDVWTRDSKKWNPLKEALKCGSDGSRVLVTTRKEEVAIMMEVWRNMITLEKLSDEHCWLVFKKLAFSERSEEDCKELDEIGRQIANKCKGLPLAAKTLGSLMRFKKTKSQWENVLLSEMWRFENDEETFAAFLLSYYDLSAKERRCFSYCSIYPKDHRMERDRLIQMWLSQKYISEEEGRECFDNLVMRSFFQNFERDDRDGSVKYCKMHDIVHDFARFVKKKEFLALQVNSSEKQILNPSSEKARHLTIVVESGAEFPVLDFTEMNKRTLQTLCILRPYVTRIGPNDLSFFNYLRCIRSLTLSACEIHELPASIGELLHLRYLDLSRNPFLKELPEALCELCNLQTLYLVGCMVGRLPEGIGNLLNLRHLYLGTDRSKDQLEAFPKGFGKLTHLRSLDQLVVAEDNAANFDVRDLKKRKNIQLRGNVLIRECRNLRSQEEATEVDLKNIGRCIDTLCLDFGISRNWFKKDEEDKGILEGLEPPKDILRLLIAKYNATILSPKWIVSLANLREIQLSYCVNCEVLPSLGKLPFLETITFVDMDSVKVVGLEFLGITKSVSPVTLFPKLEKLHFYSMPQWEKWEGINTAAAETNSSSLITIMPCLVFLKFHTCPRLKVLPDFLKTTTCLKKLVVSVSEIMQGWCREKTGNEWDKISHVPNIVIDVCKDGRFR